MRSGIEQEYGPVDVPVANAVGSASRPGPIEQISEESWRADIDGNLTVTFLTLKCFLPGTKQRRSGSIVTMSSAAGRRASGHTLVAYGVAKAGVQLLTQDLAAQVGSHGIRVNRIAPETILTEKNRRWIPDQQQKMMIESHPLRRLGTPEDVARAALYLVSDEASWITGVVPAGVVAGFVGPNGAGKTTTCAAGCCVCCWVLRVLLGLVRPTAGEGHVLGGSLRRPAGYLGRVGALIENPAFYPGLSGVDNLRVHATVGGLDSGRIPALLERVDLVERGGDPYRTYSTPPVVAARSPAPTMPTSLR